MGTTTLLIGTRTPRATEPSQKQPTPFLNLTHDLSEIERIAPSHAKQLHDLAIRQKDSSKSEELTSRALETEIEIKLFLSTMNGNYVNKNDFIKAWGEKQAVSAFDKLEDMDIITHVEGSFYRRGSLNSSFSAKDISSFLKHLINELLTGQM
jgi:hypothetical protein